MASPTGRSTSVRRSAWRTVDCRRAGDRLLASGVVLRLAVAADRSGADAGPSDRCPSRRFAAEPRRGDRRRPAPRRTIAPPSRFAPSQQATRSPTSTPISTASGPWRASSSSSVRTASSRKGVFYISRPGKIRFHYSPPVKLDVISDGRNVAVRDTRTMTQDSLSAVEDAAPLSARRQHRPDLGSVVSEVREEPDLIALSSSRTRRFVNGKLTLIFDSQTYELKQWIVTDARASTPRSPSTTSPPARRLDPGLFQDQLLPIVHDPQPICR